MIDQIGLSVLLLQILQTMKEKQKQLSWTSNDNKPIQILLLQVLLTVDMIFTPTNAFRNFSVQEDQIVIFFSWILLEITT